MAKLGDDTFSIGAPALRLDDLEPLIAARVAPVAGFEPVALRAARGRVLAHAVAALRDLPPFDNSAVDGFALRHADLAAVGETRLAVVDRVTAGHAAARPLAPGAAVRIFTGAPMPAGADTVLMQEDARLDGDVLVVPSGLKPGDNRRCAGEDIAVGGLMLPAGRRITAADIALAAAQGLTALPVRRRVSVALFSTGDEIVEPGTALPSSAIYDANRYLLLALTEALGATVTDLGILGDDADALADALRQATVGHDLVITSGGVSTGEADHVRTAVERVGRLDVWRVAIKPGKPVAMGVLAGEEGARAAFVGLPGNPAAAFVTFVRVVRPLLLRLAGATPQPPRVLPVRAGFAHRKRPGRREYLRGSLRLGADGAPEAVVHRLEGAGAITSLTETDGLIEIGDDVTAVTPGDTVGFVSYAEITG
ncbi:gephyrin-like molybdotransferase Glp [Rhodoplanes azumiensis]|uniref:Molybdopterin molybdenumtransferase n=1 Tax=Rhodoplanes azumiensis TaxID=1897628 RepID=A0ABW5AFQ2_9BRAD